MEGSIDHVDQVQETILQQFSQGDVISLDLNMVEYPYSLVCRGQVRVVQFNHQQKPQSYQEDEENYQSEEEDVNQPEEEDFDVQYADIKDYNQ